MQEFSEDLRRHLEGFRYMRGRIPYLTDREFITDIRGGVVAVLIVVLTLLSATLITGWQVRVATRT